MAGSTLISNLARAAKILALLLFLLPWVTISCSPQALSQGGGPDAAAMAGAGDVTIARATGTQLAMGTVVATNPNPSASPPPNPFDRPNYAIMGGALLIMLSLAATFLLKGSRGAIAAAGGCALAAAALCYAMLVQVPAAVRASFAGGGGGAGASPLDPLELARLIQVKVEIGFWLTIAALVAAVVLNLLGMRGAAAAAPAAAAGAAPTSPKPPAG